MSDHLKSILALAVLLLLCYTGYTGFEIYKKYTQERTIASNTNIRRAKSLLKQYAQYSDALRKSNSPETSSGKIVSPFGTFRAPIKGSSEPKIEFDRIPLVLKGIIDGKRKVVLLKERSGKTHPLSKGEKVHDRKVIKITTTSVILKDKLGNDTLFVE